MFEPPNVTAGGFQIDKNIPPYVVYWLIFSGKRVMFSEQRRVALCHARSVRRSPDSAIM
jgi:hypothetical protein